MKNIYTRLSTYSLWLGSVSFFALLIIAFLLYKDFLTDLESLLSLIIVSFFAFSSHFYFKWVSEKLPDTVTQQSHSDFVIKEFILQKDISFISRKYLMSNVGEKLFVIEPTSRNPIARFLSVFSLISAGYIIPITYEVLTLEGNRLFSFTIKNDWKQFRVIVRNELEEVIGEYRQSMLKSAVKNRGTLYNADENVWRDIEAKNMAGDIDIRDEDNRVTASYRFGRFPYAMHPAFQAQSENLHIGLGDHISEDERKSYLAIFYFWFTER